MTPAERKLVIDTLKTANPAGTKLLMERLGDEAFEMIMTAMTDGSLSVREKVHGLMRLLLLTRQQCFERRDEVLLLALSLTSDPEIEVRSIAVTTAILGSRGLEKSARTIRRERVQSAVRKGLALGLSDQAERLSRTFLAA